MDMRQPSKKATGDEKRESKLSPADGRWWRHDPRWMPEESVVSCKTRTKMTVRPHGFSDRKESQDGWLNHWLTGGERQRKKLSAAVKMEN
jgi:hypothetical protein